MLKFQHMKGSPRQPHKYIEYNRKSTKNDMKLNILNEKQG